MQNARIVQNYKEAKEDIEAFLTKPLNSGQLQELKTALDLVDASNIDKTAKEEDLVKLFQNITDTKQRNKHIFKVIEKGYSQHMITKVLVISRPVVCSTIKRNKNELSHYHLRTYISCTDPLTGGFETLLESL